MHTQNNLLQKNIHKPSWLQLSIQLFFGCSPTSCLSLNLCCEKTSRYDYHTLQHVPWPQSTSYTTLYNQRYLLLLPKHVGIDLVSASLCINWLLANQLGIMETTGFQETDRLLCTVVHRVVLLTVVELMQMDFLFMHPLLFPLCVCSLHKHHRQSSSNPWFNILVWQSTQIDLIILC